MEINQTPLQQKLAEPFQLPTLTKNLPVLIQALSDHSLNYLQLAEVIKQYPEITARLIFLANSPWSAPISPVSSIEQACSRLGTSIIKSISIATSIAISFNTKKCPGFDTLHFWTTSLLVSKGAGILASRLTNKIADIEFVQTTQTAGILHNLGLLWLADKLPVETDRAFQLIEDDPTLTLSTALKQFIGSDYCEIGGWIGSQMEFPEVLISAVHYHLTPDYQQSSWEIPLLIGASATMASALFNQTKAIPSNSRLEQLGLDSSTQTFIFQQLSKDFESTRELAKILFEGPDNT
ncbi:MAG: HDOD domain-containing protein [Methylococcaceae bacterium]